MGTRIFRFALAAIILFLFVWGFLRVTRYTIADVVRIETLSLSVKPPVTSLKFSFPVSQQKQVKGTLFADRWIYPDIMTLQTYIYFSEAVEIETANIVQYTIKDPSGKVVEYAGTDQFLEELSNKFRPANLYTSINEFLFSPGTYHLSVLGNYCAASMSNSDNACSAFNLEADFLIKRTKEGEFILFYQ